MFDEGHQVGPHLSVPFGRLGVETDDEALAPRSVAHADLFHLEVARRLVVAAGTRERLLGLVAGMAQPLGHHVVAAAALEVGAVGGKI